MTTFVVDAPPALYSSNPYGLAFSPDGSKLAIGSGGWYGGGGISLVDMDSGEDMTLRFVNARQADGVAVAAFDWGHALLTVSGVAFDGSGEFLAACSWASGQRDGPTFLFRVSGGGLEHHSTFEVQKPHRIFERCPTGLCFMQHRLYVRNSVRRLEDMFQSFPVPPEVDTDITTAHRSHARVARVEAPSSLRAAAAR